MHNACRHGQHIGVVAIERLAMLIRQDQTVAHGIGGRAQLTQHHAAREGNHAHISRLLAKGYIGVQERQRSLDDAKGRFFDGWRELVDIPVHVAPAALHAEVFAQAFDFLEIVDHHHPGEDQPLVGFQLDHMEIAFRFFLTRARQQNGFFGVDNNRRDIVLHVKHGH